ncbi:MAG TPA: hypothetical protein VF533_23045 [Solirubrobacteraceae bacterium]
MRRTLVLAAACAAALAAAAPASASTSTLATPSPLTAAQRSAIVQAGAKGVQVPAEQLNVDCPGYAARGVSAGACIVAPAGCTANFIFTDGTYKYIGTARHCVDKVGQSVIMQVDTTTLAAVGTVTKFTAGEGVPGNDFALIRIAPAVAKKWGVNPALPQGGPKGIYTGCGPVAVTHYGHGYGVAVSQGKLEGGLATNWNNAGFGWTGAGAPGDSGSAVLTASGQAAGDFTHLIVDLGQYPGSDLAGTRITKILAFAGTGVRLVNADGTTARATSTNC